MKLYSYSLLIFLSLSLFSIKANNQPEIHNIISGTLNGTAAFVSLESIDSSQKYLYFTFDFKFHSSAVPKNSNIAYFDINADFKLIGHHKEKMKFGFSEKNCYDIKTEEDFNDIKWKTMKPMIKEKTENDWNYYIKIKRRKEIKNTLILRIPVNDRKEGYITIGNILELPQREEKEKNSDI